MSVKWLCKRCAEQTETKIEEEPMILRICSNCGVENYCFPAGHAGEDVEPTEEEKAISEKPSEVGIVEASPEEDIDTAPPPEPEPEPEKELSDKEKEIAELEAKLKALTGG
jgi:hypothetical protein